MNAKKEEGAFNSACNECDHDWIIKNSRKWILIAVDDDGNICVTDSNQEASKQLNNPEHADADFNLIGLLSVALTITTHSIYLEGDDNEQ